MSALLNILFEMVLWVPSATTKGTKRPGPDFEKAGINKPVFILCTLIWFCVVFVLSVVFH